MAAATASRETARKEGILVDYTPVDDVVIYKGLPAFAKATGGKAFTNDGTVNTLANGDVFIGVTAEPCNEANGEDTVRVYQDGLFLMTFSDTLTGDNVGDDVFTNNTVDDGAVTVTGITGAPQCTIGRIAQFVSANQAYVRINGAMFNKAVTL